jgi:hypothetical protein
MTKRLKFIGFLAVAIMAMSAVAASAASAANFGTESAPTFLKGVQETKNVFTVSGGTVKCTGAEFTSAEIKNKEETSITVHPTYTGCTAFGQAATVNTTGCNYILTATSTTTGGVVVECEKTIVGGKEVEDKIVVTANTAGCTITVKAQTPTNNMVDYENKGSGATASVLVTSTVEGLTYESTGGICGAPGNNGTYTGSVLTKGYNTAGFVTQHGIFVV